MGLFNLFKPAKAVLVVDVVSLNESLGMKGKVPPRNQLQMLRRLARFAQREKMELFAVLTGTPLNKAPAGKKFEEITILYTKSPDTHAKGIAKIAASKGAGAILISGNAAAEKIVGSSCQKMRVSTFRKAFDAGGEGEPGNGNGGEGSRSRGNRPRRDRPRNKKSDGGGGDKKRDKKRDNNKRDAKPKEMSEADAINELIDLVD